MKNQRIIFAVLFVLLTASFVVAAEVAEEEVLWCEDTPEMPEATEVPETRDVECWGSLAECENLAEEFYWGECMVDAWAYAASVCLDEYAGVCFSECFTTFDYDCRDYFSDPLVCWEHLNGCMTTTCGGSGWGYDHFMFTCMNHYLGWGSLECLSAKETYLINCACNE